MPSYALALHYALCALYLLPGTLAAPLAAHLYARADDEKKPAESDKKDDKSAKDEAEEGRSSVQQYAKIQVAGIPLYIVLLLVTGLLIILLGGVYWYRKHRKEKRLAEERRKEDEMAAAADQQAEMDRRTGGMPNPEEEFEGDGDDDAADGRSFEDEEKRGDPNFLQVQR